MDEAFRRQRHDGALRVYGFVRKGFEDPYEVLRWIKEAEGWDVKEEATRATGDQGTLVVVWAVPPKEVT